MTNDPHAIEPAWHDAAQDAEFSLERGLDACTFCKNAEARIESDDGVMFVGTASILVDATGYECSLMDDKLRNSFAACLLHYDVSKGRASAYDKTLIVEV